MTSLKDSFVGSYPISKEDVEAIWEDSVIVFDTNVLLNLYRCSKKTQDILLKILAEYQERIWLPYHVGKEFFKNRVNVIAKQEDVFSEFKEKILLDKLISEVNEAKDKHIAIETTAICKILKEANEKIIQELQVFETSIIDYLKDDYILSALNQLFGEKIGKKYTELELDDLTKKAKLRYDKETPPGYADKKKNGNQYGDCIIWLQIIEYINNKQKSLIFVTRDNKEDWFQIYKGKTIGSRPELIEEILENTSQKCLIYGLKSFINKATEKLGITDNVLEAIKEIQNINYVTELDECNAKLLSYGCTIEDICRIIYSFKQAGKSSFTTMDIVRKITGGKYSIGESINQIIPSILYKIETDLFAIYDSGRRRTEKDDNGRSTSLVVWEFDDNSIFCGDSDGKGNLYCYNCKSYRQFSGVKCTHCGSYRDD